MEAQVQLSSAELAQCVIQAMTRMTASRYADRNQARSVNRTWFQHLKDELVGVIAENGYCKWKGIYPSREVDTFHRVADTADGAEIRSITNANNCLIVRNDDPKERPYVLVLVDSNAVCSMLGWVYGYEARQDKWLRDPGGKRASWFVPQESLRPIESLRADRRAANGTHPQH